MSFLIAQAFSIISLKDRCSINLNHSQISKWFPLQDDTGSLERDKSLKIFK